MASTMLFSRLAYLGRLLGKSGDCSLIIMVGMAVDLLAIVKKKVNSTNDANFSCHSMVYDHAVLQDSLFM